MRQSTHDTLLWLAGIGGAIVIAQVIANVIVWFALLLGFATWNVPWLWVPLAAAAICLLLFMRTRLEPP